MQGLVLAPVHFLSLRVIQTKSTFNYSFCCWVFSLSIGQCTSASGFGLASPLAWCASSWCLLWQCWIWDRWTTQQAMVEFQLSYWATNQYRKTRTYSCQKNVVWIWKWLTRGLYFCLTLSLLRVIKVKFPLQPQQKYYTWVFIAYSDERWFYYQFSLPHSYIFSVIG